MTRHWIALAVCAFAWGCVGDDPAGNPPVDRVLAPGELVEPVSIETSWVSFQVRSAVLEQYWGEAGLPGRYGLGLLEGDGGCAALGETTLGRGTNELQVYPVGLIDGTCTTGVPCEVSVSFRPAPGGGLPAWTVSAESASLILSQPFDGWRLAGELRAAFPRDPEFRVAVERDAAGRDWLLCASPEGRYRRCGPNAEGSDCCNDGKPLEEWVIPFEAAFCPAAVTCFPGEACVAATAVACPAPEEPVDCVSACEHATTLCHVAYDCEPGEWICPSTCDPLEERCPVECASTSAYPVFATAFACLETHDTADGWTTCMQDCGDTP